jgi:hypothetical protein
MIQSIYTFYPLFILRSSTAGDTIGIRAGFNTEMARLLRFAGGHFPIKYSAVSD